MYVAQTGEVLERHYIVIHNALVTLLFVLGGKGGKGEGGQKPDHQDQEANLVFGRISPCGHSCQ